jgi:hypothetical protein
MTSATYWGSASSARSLRRPLFNVVYADFRKMLDYFARGFLRPAPECIDAYVLKQGCWQAKIEYGKAGFTNF